MDNSKLEEQLNEFKKATEPAIKWLQKHGDPNQKIIIELGGVELVSGQMGFPVTEVNCTRISVKEI